MHGCVSAFQSVSHNSYLINQSVFLKPAIFSWPSPSLGDLPPAGTSWREACALGSIHFGRDGRVLAGYNFHRWGVSDTEHPLPHLEEAQSRVELGNAI